MSHRESPLAELSALVGVVALVLSVTYSDAAYDSWDSLVGLVSATFGSMYLGSLLRDERNWNANHIVFAGFLVTALIVGGAATLLLGVTRRDGAVWESVGPWAIMVVGIVVSGALYGRERRQQPPNRPQPTDRCRE